MQTKEQFIAKVLPWALQTAQRTGLDPRLIIAQSALESGWGNSKLTQNENNYFGIKDFSGDGRDYKTTEFFPDGAGNFVDSFATYPGLKQSFEAYEKLMNRPRYQNVLEADGLENQIIAMAESGFATDPNYARKLLSVSNSINLNNNSLIPSVNLEEKNMGIFDNLTGDAFSEGMPQNNPVPGPGSMQPPKPKPTFISQIRDYLSDEGNRDKLALAFNSMTINPDQGISNMLNTRIKTRQEMDYLTGQTNKTAEYFESINRPDLAEQIRNGVDASLVYKSYADEVGGIRDATSSLRKEFNATKVVERFTKQTASYQTILDSVEDPSPAGDMALIFNFMKVLDPGSTVREGEYATAKQAGSIPDRLRNLYNTTLMGYTLSDAQRADFVNRAGTLYSGARDGYDKFRGQYEGIATRGGLNIEDALPRFAIDGELLKIDSIPVIDANDIDPMPDSFKNDYFKQARLNGVDANEAEAKSAWQQFYRLNRNKPEKMAEYQ